MIPWNYFRCELDDSRHVAIVRVMNSRLEECAQPAVWLAVCRTLLPSLHGTHLLGIIAVRTAICGNLATDIVISVKELRYQHRF
jgi:hypothetical protein